MGCPRDVALREAPEIQIDFSDAGTRNEQYGIYRVGSQGAAYMETSRDEGRLTARTLELGRFTVLEDTIPPIILNVLPAPGSVIRDPLPRITVSFRDTLSGLS